MLAGLVLVLAPPTESRAGKLRIAAWNIANLHHESGVELRPGIGTRRTDNDYETLREYEAKVGADVYALQEIGTRRAAERLFPSEEFEIRMSGRFDSDVAAGNEGGIYTAIALRRDSGARIIRQDDLEELSVIHVEDGESSPQRQGTAVLLEIDGTQLWILSVHLKSSCATTRGADESRNADCKTFWKQRVPIKRWIDARVAEEMAFVIAGDFNRRFRQFGLEGPFWEFITGDEDEPLLDIHPQTVTRKCPTRKGRSTQPIDWILLDADIAHWFKRDSFWETRFRDSDITRHGGRRSQRLSDHCPIHIDLDW